MQPRSDTDLLAFYGVTEPPVGSVWTWHTLAGHQVTAVATHSPTDRLGRAGGIPAVDARRLVDHPANVGILAAIFREHVCATAYAVLVVDPDGKDAPRWAVCDGDGRTSTPSLTQIEAWLRALTHNADPDIEGPWANIGRPVDDLRASLKAARVGRDGWKTEAGRARERADIAEGGLKAAGRLLGVEPPADVEALGNAVCSRASRLVALRANICRDLGLNPDDETADIAEAIAALKHNAGHHTVDGVSLADIIDARTHLLGLLDLEWDASADDVSAGAARLSGILKGAAAHAAQAVENHDAEHDGRMRAESQADVLASLLAAVLREFGMDVPKGFDNEAIASTARQLLRHLPGAHLARLVKFTVAEDFEHLWLSTAASVVQRACSTHGVETISELSAQLLKANAGAAMREATINHLRAHHRGVDPQAMALAWEHDPALAEDLTHPIFRVLPVYLDERDAEHEAAALFAYTSTATNVADGVVVGLNDDGSLWANLDTPIRLRPVEREIIGWLIEGLSRHRGVQALLGMDDAETARGFIRVETTVPF